MYKYYSPLFYYEDKTNQDISLFACDEQNYFRVKLHYGYCKGNGSE